MSCIWYLLKEKGKKNGFSITSALFQRETKPASSHIFLKYCLSFLSSTCALPPSIFHIHCGLPGLSASSEVMTDSWGSTQAILAEPNYQENTPVSPSTQHGLLNLCGHVHLNWCNALEHTRVSPDQTSLGFSSWRAAPACVLAANKTKTVHLHSELGYNSSTASEIGGTMSQRCKKCWVGGSSGSL